MEWQRTPLNLPSRHTCIHLGKTFRTEIFSLQWLLSRSVPYTPFVESPLKLMMYGDLIERDQNRIHIIRRASKLTYY